MVGHDSVMGTAPDLHDELMALAAKAVRDRVAATPELWRAVPFAVLLATHNVDTMLPLYARHGASHLWWSNKIHTQYEGRLSSAALSEAVHGLWRLRSVPETGQWPQQMVAVDLASAEIVAIDGDVRRPALDREVVESLSSELPTDPTPLIECVPWLLEMADTKNVLAYMDQFRITPRWFAEHEAPDMASACLRALAGSWQGDVPTLLKAAHALAEDEHAELIETLASLSGSWCGSADELVASARMLVTGARS